MFGSKKSFENKKLKQLEIKKKKNTKWFIKSHIKWFFSLWLIFVIFYFWTNISYVLWTYVKTAIWWVVQTISKTMWKEAKKDALWNVNILLLWIWGKNHDWGYLTDSMMIASFNSKYKTLTFMSIPRDLYVKYPWWWAWRINYIFAREYLKTRSFDKAAKTLQKKIKDITWIKTDYYILVDFWWFEKFVDKLWWVTINVPETLVDYRYPWPNWTYVTFKITKWVHHIDGVTALKYARSRHSTSDFSRSARQEQIIKALIHQVTSSWILTSPSKIKALCLQFKETFKTNFDFDTMLSFVQYAKWIKIHSYVINADCYFKTTYWKNLIPWCFLYPAERAAFNWQAVLLPVWATPQNIENYEKIQKFAFIAIGYPELWLENSKIQILNWINKRKIKKYYKWYLKPVASNLAYTLKNYWFNIVDVRNSSKYYKSTIWYIYNNKPTTEELLKSFVWQINYKTGDVNYAWSWFDMTLILWENYLK